MKRTFFTLLPTKIFRVGKSMALTFSCFFAFFLINNTLHSQCPDNLDIVFTGDADNDVCQNGNNLILTVSGNNIPNNPNYITWYGGLSEGTNPGQVADNGLTGVFYARNAPPASYTICADVGPPGCVVTICENMIVIEEQVLDLDDAKVICSISASGIFNLDGLIDGDDSSSNIYGGEWSMSSNAGANVSGNTLEYFTAGCFELIYDAHDTNDGSCNVENKDVHVLITQQPQPNFDILDQICYVEGSNITLTALVNSPLYKFNGLPANPIRTWTSSDDDIATVNAAGVVSVKSTGIVHICLDETLNYAKCGSGDAVTCSEQFCQEIVILPMASNLDITLTSHICDTESDRHLTVTGNHIPTDPDHITWYGGLGGGSGNEPGDVKDHGTDGTFFSNGAPAGTYTVCADVGPPGCVATICEDIIVVEEQIVTLSDGAVECSISASGIFNLDGLIDGENSTENAYGGTWTLTPNPGGTIVGNSLQYSTAGCYEVTYDPPATLDDDCDESPKTAYLFVTQQPQPGFDIQDQVCYSAGDPPVNHVYPALINSPAYSPNGDLTRTWSISSGPATVDNSGNVTITGTGIVVVCMDETLAFEACGSNEAVSCSEIFCQQISVSDGTAQDASFTFSDSEFCIGDVIILTATTPGGEFTGQDVVDDGNGMTGSYTITTCGTFPVTYTLNDPNGCTASYTLNIETDKIAPELSLPTETNTAECGSGSLNDILEIWKASASATDNCPGVAVSSILFNTISKCGDTEEQVWQFTATDACGNTTVKYASFHIVDTTPPSIDIEAQDMTVECDGNSNPAQLIGWLNDHAGAEASDLCGSVSWSHDYGVNGNILSNLCGETGAVTVIFYATDECGNVANTSATFTIEDTTAPTIFCPADISMECKDTNNEAIIANWLASAYASDICSDVFVSNDFSALPECGSSVIVTFTVEDNCDGEIVTCSATISVIDTKKPVIMTPPSDLFVECDGSEDPNGTIAAWAASFGGMIAVDQCDPNPVLSFNTGTPFNLCGGSKTIPYTFTATDVCGNMAISEIAYAHIIDTTPPVISIASDPGPVSCDVADPLDWAASAVTVDVEACSETIIDYALVNIDYSCDDAAVYHFIFTVTDECGNIATAPGIYSTHDITAPIITAPENLHLECGEDFSTLIFAWLDDYSVSDNCSSLPDIAVTHDFDSLPDLCGGSVTVTWIAEDDCGNMASASADIIITDDNMPPVFINCPDDLSVGVDVDECAAFVIYSTPVAQDCNGVASVVLTSGIPSGQNFPLGTTTIVFTATDNCGNESTCTFDITVVDTDDPNIFCPSNDVVVCADLGTCAWISDASISPTLAIENCPNYTITYEISGATTASGNNDATGETLNLGTSVITYTILDANGNPEGTCSFNVIVEDCEAPTIDCFDELDVECSFENVEDWIEAIEATAADLCSDVTVETILFLDISGCGNTIEQQYLFTVTDEAGNTTNCIATYESDDTTPPVIEVDELDVTVECENFSGNNDVALLSWLVNNGGLEATDACSDAISWSHDFDAETSFEPGCGNTGVYTVNFTATDECGNSTTQQLTFSIVDTTSPVFFNCPASNVVVDAPAGWCASFANFSLPNATDNCSEVTVTQIDGTGLSSGSLFPVGTTILSWEAVDACGNADTCMVKVIVNDYHTPPVISCPSDVEVTNDPLMCGAVVDDIALESIDDNCPDNLAVTYTIKDIDGNLLECGFEDASGFKFPVGTNTVEYFVQDQPLLLITEISQSGAPDQIEITNFGPADLDISCLVIERTSDNPTADETFIVPNGVIVAAGETYIFDFAFDGDASLAACYVISYGNQVFDQVATNGAMDCSGFSGVLDSGDIFRKMVCDTDTADDWALIDACNMASIGSLNPGLPQMPANSTLTSLQSEAPSIATCSFEVTVNDEEAPFCAKHDSLEYMVPGLPLVINDNSICTEINVSINTPYIVGDVNIVSLEGNYPDMGALRFKLISPSGTEVLLFEELCAGEADFDLGLDDDAVNPVANAACGPLGAGQVFTPFEMLKNFFGENALGIWTLEITSSSTETGSLDNFVLQVNALEEYVPEDVTLANDPGECGAEYTWLHPLVGDNCCIGAISVEYTSDDAECVPDGGLLDGMGGYYATEFFCVGTTTVTYSLLDAWGNTSTCSFTVTVEDQENPIAICPPDITFNLDAGECEIQYSFNVTGTDNCGVVNSWSIPPSGSFFEVGTTEVTIFVEDAAGNQSSCTFNVTVKEYQNPDTGLACNDLVNLSLDENCEFCITPDVILEGSSYTCYNNYIVEIYECHPGCDPIPTSPCLTLENIGQTLIVVVTDPVSGNSCWGEVFVEDKLNPEVACPEDVTIKCNDSIEPSFTGEPILESCETSVTIEYEDDYTDNGNCGDPRAVIERTWTITDESGNSTGCVQIITIEPFDLADVSFPADLDNFTLPALECIDVLEDPSLTDPSNTGQPMINGLPLMLGGLCHFSINVTDDIYDVCNNSYEILRTFNVRNMCLPLGPGNPLSHTQIIKVLDMTPPLIENCQQTIQLFTGNNSCTAEFDPDVNGLTVTDECSGVVDISVSSSTGSFELPLGTSVITYTAKDQCGNIATCNVDVEVIDATPPVPVCLASYVVGLTADEPAYVGALAFNNGSFDNCQLAGFKVRRMDNPNCPGNDATEFGDYVPFYCCDVNQDGDVVLVELQVIDAAGNTNSCMVEVEVQDKLSPAIQCPPNIVLDCYADPYDLNVTGFAIATDNCSAELSYINQGSLDNCGEGTIFRIWTATDPGGRTSSCVQSIQVVNSSPFFITDTNCFNQNPNDGVIWPCDYETDTCAPGLTPDITGEPTIIEDGCDLVAVNYEDLNLSIQDPACLKILRTWTVVDWCSYNPATGAGYWEYTQTIKVLNSETPVILSDCEDVAFCTYNPNCLEGSAELVLEANDDCTDSLDLNYYYWIDLHSNGTFEIHDEGQDASHAHLNYTNGQLDFPLGTHTIRWDVEDGCGNVATCTYQFIIADCKAPTPVVIEGLAVELMENCEIELWANDWDNPSSPSFDNCGIAEWLVQSPSQGPGQTVPPVSAMPSWIFTTVGAHTVDIWIRDINGNWAYTTTYIMVENNTGPECNGQTNNFQISGEIANEEAETINEVAVHLEGSIPGIYGDILTESTGLYEFSNLPEMANYVVTPEKNTNHLNGVSTFDIVLITRHILAIEKLNSPYKIIAADINHSGTVTAFDLVHLRRLILFIDDEFQDNTSWRFVDAGFVFPDPENPFASQFPEIFSVNGLDQDIVADFIGMKIGDVNGSAIPNNLTGSTADRTVNGELEFILDDREMVAGESYDLVFTANDFKNILGYQFTFNFDPEIIEFNDMKPGKLRDLAEHNFGFTLLDKGVITTSWNSDAAVDMDADEPLFSLNFTAQKTVRLSDVLSIGSRYTMAEAYNPNGLLDVTLGFRTAQGDIRHADRFELYQNQPNPFKDETNISFYLPSATSGTLTIYDVSGNEVKAIRGDFNAGYNEISISKSELAGFGVLYYRLATPLGTAVKTMTLIR